MEERLAEEFLLLKEVYPAAVRKDRWFWIPEYPLPEGWSHRLVPVSFFVRDGYPGTSPYGFHVPADLTFNGTKPNNFTDADAPPFEGNWAIFSWEAEGWRPTADPRGGHNLVTWARGFNARFKEGV